MGCDIHSRCEVKKEGNWFLNKENIFKNPYDWTIKEDGEFLPHPGDSRNYDWFAILADVRNGRGFAGVKTGDGFMPISEPKGVPEDATNEWKQYVQEWGNDLHSMSYLSVSDFDNYDWDRYTEKQGVIPIKQYEKLQPKNETPDNWSGGVSGPNIVVIQMSKADELLTGKTVYIQSDKNITLKPDTTKDVYVVYRWKIHYKDWFKDKIKEYVTPMNKLKERYEDVRLVFGFDN